MSITTSPPADDEAVTGGTTSAAVAGAADTPPDELDGVTRSEATAWFLDENAETEASGYLPVNVATIGKSPKWINFGVQVIPRERVQQLREEARVTKSDGTKEVDEMEANLRIAVEALIDPDLTNPANRVVRGTRYTDPADALVARFAHKPGLIDQIAGAIVKASGYNDADVKEVRAAGN